MKKQYLTKWHKRMYGNRLKYFQIILKVIFILSLSPEQFAKHFVATIQENENGTIMVIKNNKRAKYSPVSYEI